MFINESLFEAINRHDLEQVKHLVEEVKLDVNSLHLDSLKSPS